MGARICSNLPRRAAPSTAIEAELFGVLTEDERAAFSAMLARVREGAGEFDPAALAD